MKVHFCCHVCISPHNFRYNYVAWERDTRLSSLHYKRLPRAVAHASAFSRTICCTFQRHVSKRQTVRFLDNNWRNWLTDIKKSGISDSLCCGCEDQSCLWRDAVRPQRRPSRGGKNVHLLLWPRLVTHLTTYKNSVFHSLMSKTTIQIFQPVSWIIKQNFYTKKNPVLFRREKFVHIFSLICLDRRRFRFLHEGD